MKNLEKHVKPPVGLVLALAVLMTAAVVRTPSASARSANPSWSLTGSLNAARNDHTATLLPGGKVLVAGGWDGASILKSAELYNPATGTWSATGSLVGARYWSAATLLQSGKVLIAGGSDDEDLASTLASAELYDPAAGTWSATGALNRSRVLHTATLLNGGKVLVEGGEALPNVLSSAELYEPAARPNPVDDARFFVAQHYRDFLGRDPDDEGLQFWTNEIASCGDDAQCREVKRVNVSAAFFLSIEFQNTGYLVERMYKVAYGDTTDSSAGLVIPIIRRSEFTADAPLIGSGVIVGRGSWEATLENNKAAYAQAFVQRQRFTDIYGSLSPADYVDRLDQNAGGVLTAGERQGFIDELSADNGVANRGSVLRRVAENAELDRRERNRAFVLMEYYGYLRRNPNDAPEAGLNYVGWNSWLVKLDQFNGDAVAAEMVNSFLVSSEYRSRFVQ